MRAVNKLCRTVPRGSDIPCSRGFAWLALAVLVTACGGSGGSSDDDDEGGDFTAPTARILFPPANGVTDAETITVTGTAADAGTVTIVRVNGVDAVTGDGFATWRAQVPLTAGANDLVVETGDQAGNMNMNAAGASLLNRPMYNNPVDMDFAGAGNRLLVADRISRELTGIDFDDDSRSRISGRADAPARLESIVYDIAGDRVISVADGFNPHRLYSIDLATGIHTLLSANGAPVSAANFGADIRALGYDDSLGAGMERVLTVEGSDHRIISVDLATGDRTVLSENGDGKGDDLVFPIGIAVDTANNRALISDSNPPFTDIVAVDLTTGARTLISPNGGVIGVFSDLALDAASERLYAIDADSVIEIVLTTGMTLGDRSTLSDDLNGAGPDFGSLSAITMDTLANRLLVADDGLDAVFAVDLATGDRTIVDDNFFGVGEAFISIKEIELDPDTDRAYVYDQAGKIIRVELDSGARSVVTDDSDSQPNQLTGVAGGIGIDLGNKQMLVATAHPSTLVDRLIGVDLATGVRNELASPSPDQHEARAIIHDAAGNRAITAILTASNPRLNQIDLATGVDTIFSGSLPGGMPIGAGADFVFTPITGIALDAGNDRVLVMQGIASQFRLIEVDLASGERIQLLQAGNAPGGNTLGKFELDTARNRLLMVDQQNEIVALPGLVYTDLDDNSHDVFANLANGEGIDFIRPEDIAIHAQRDLAVVLDTGLRGLVAVDLESGDRVLFSK